MSEEERKLLQVRLPLSLVRTIEHLAVDWDMYVRETVEKLLKEALEKYVAKS